MIQVRQSGRVLLAVPTSNGSGLNGDLPPEARSLQSWEPLEPVAGVHRERVARAFPARGWVVAELPFIARGSSALEAPLAFLQMPLPLCILPHDRVLRKGVRAAQNDKTWD